MWYSMLSKCFLANTVSEILQMYFQLNICFKKLSVFFKHSCISKSKYFKMLTQHLFNIQCDKSSSERYC